MGALAEFLFPAPARRSVGSIIGWWERRRFAYNVVVGAAGAVSLGLTSLIAILPGGPGLPPSFPWIGVVMFGAMANVCYTFGPATEILIEKMWGRGLLPTGPTLFRMGLTFSVGLALFPTLLMVFVLVARIAFSIF
jgi:hypothetical protein